MTPREFTESAAHVREALEAGEVVEVRLDVDRGGGPIGLMFVPLDVARINATTERIFPELGVGADWALVWSAPSGRAAPFRLLELGEHDNFRWSHVALELDLFSDDAKVVAAFAACVGRVPSDIDDAWLEEKLDTRDAVPA